MKATSRRRTGRMAVWTIQAVVLVAFLDLFMQLPVIAAYSKSLGASASMGGLIVGMYSASNIVGNAFAGSLLDRLDHKRLIGIGLLLTSASLYLYTIVETPGQLLALRAFHGLAAGVLAPGAFAMLGRREGRRDSHSMGTSGALIATCAVVGPPLAGYIRHQWGFEAVFATSATILLLAAAVFLWRAPSGPEREVENGEQDGCLSSEGMWLRLAPVFGILLALTFSLGTLFNQLPVALEATAGDASQLPGLAFATFSLVAAGVMIGYARGVFDRSSEKLVVLGGLLFLGVGGLILGATNVSHAPTFGAMVAFGLGFGMLFPTLAALVSSIAPNHRKGIAFGIFYALYSLGVVIGAVASGIAEGADISLGAPFFLCLGAALLVAPVVGWVRGGG